MQNVGEQVSQAVNQKVQEVLDNGGYGKVMVEVTIRHSKPEYIIEKTQTRPVKE